MNDNVQRLSEALGLMSSLADLLMRAIQAQPGRVSVSDLAEIRRFEAAAREGIANMDLADSIAATRRTLVRLNAIRTTERSRRFDLRGKASQATSV